MKKTTNGYFTLEAAILFPTILYIVFLLMFLLTYLYDYVLLFQDINEIEASYKMSEQDFYYLYREIVEERPYILTDEIGISVEDNGKTKRVIINCIWEMPLIANYSKEIVMSRDIKIIDPVEIMRLSRSFTDHNEEKQNDTYESNQ